MNRLTPLIFVFFFILSACTTTIAQPTQIQPTTPTSDGVAAIHEISFTDLIPQDLHFREVWCWNAVGIDHMGRVYMGIGGETPDAQDVAVVRYDPASGEGKFLTTLRTVSQQANNLKPGEEMPKGHTRIVEMNGKMYLGSQGFHDIFEIDPTVRGAHLFEIDEVSGTIQDLSTSDPDGVSISNQGIIAVDVIPEKNLVVGLGHPSGQIVIYDLATQHSTIYTNPEAAQFLGRNISRHIVYSAKYNRIYTSFAGTPMLRLDLNTGDYTTLLAANGEFNFEDNDFVTAMAKNHDGSQVYYIVPSGYMYHFDVDTEKLTRLGTVNTPDELAQNVQAADTFSLVMSNDEKYLYSIPSSMSDGHLGLYRYDIAIGVWSELANLTEKFGGKYAPFTGGEIDAQGRIYFAYYSDEDDNDPWVRLLQIDVNHLLP